MLIGRDGRWSHDGAELSSWCPAPACSAPRSPFRSCTARSARTGRVQGLLECLDVPYVGCDVLASAICMDKLTLKRLLAERGVPQVDFVQAGEEGWRERIAAMGSPLWVKPSRLGSSVGNQQGDAGTRARARRSSWRCATTRG